MTTLLVSDTSVLVDLHRGGLLERLFRLSYEFGVPDVLFERELKHWDGPALEPLGLKVLVLDSDGVTLAQTYRSQERKLSIPDAFALALAKIGGRILLAGDASLRQLAEAERVECHGVLWVLDVLEEHGAVRPFELLEGLTRITTHPRCRLPGNESRSRLDRYRRRLRVASTRSSE